MNVSKHTSFYPQLTFRLCLGVWRGGEGKALEGGKYREKWRNLSHFFERVFFLENHKLMLMIHIFLILRIL